MFKYGNKVNKNQLKRELCESISKNIDCIDYLEGLENKAEDNYNYSGLENDRIELQMIKWIKFQLEYCSDRFADALKKNGGNVHVIQSAEWK